MIQPFTRPSPFTATRIDPNQKVFYDLALNKIPYFDLIEASLFKRGE